MEDEETRTTAPEVVDDFEDRVARPTEMGKIHILAVAYVLATVATVDAL